MSDNQNNKMSEANKGTEDKKLSPEAQKQQDAEKAKAEQAKKTA